MGILAAMVSITSYLMQLNALEKSNLTITWSGGRLHTNLCAAWTAASAPPETRIANCCGCKALLLLSITWLLAQFAAT